MCAKNSSQSIFSKLGRVIQLALPFFHVPAFVIQHSNISITTQDCDFEISGLDYNPASTLFSVIKKQPAMTIIENTSKSFMKKSKFWKKRSQTS
jgi:hypothetical protein